MSKEVITKQESLQLGAIVTDGILLAKQIWLTGTNENRNELVKVVGDFIYDAVQRIEAQEQAKREAWRSGNR